jgi:hypothetical protein
LFKESSGNIKLTALFAPKGENHKLEGVQILNNK